MAERRRDSRQRDRRINLTLPPKVKEAVLHTAASERRTPSQWIALAVMDYLGIDEDGERADDNPDTSL